MEPFYLSTWFMNKYHFLNDKEDDQQEGLDLQLLQGQASNLSKLFPK